MPAASVQHISHMYILRAGDGACAAADPAPAVRHLGRGRPLQRAPAHGEVPAHLLVCLDCAMLGLGLMSIDSFPVFHECPACKAGLPAHDWQSWCRADRVECLRNNLFSFCMRFPGPLCLRSSMYGCADNAYAAQTNLLRRKSGGIIARCAACVDLPAVWDGEVEANGRALTEVGENMSFGNFVYKTYMSSSFYSTNSPN